MDTYLQAKTSDSERTGGHEHLGDPLNYIHRALRGRYYLLIGLGAALGIAGAAIGYRSDVPRYKSEGLVRIAYIQPQLVNQDDSQPMTMFDARLRAMEQKMTSKAAIDLAMAEPVWRDVSSETGEQAMTRFAEALTVEHQANSELLHISFASPDPTIASAGVKSVVAVFVRDYNATEQIERAQQLQALDAQAEDLTRKLKEIHDEGAAPSGTMDASTDFTLLQTRKENLYVRLNQTRKSLQVAEDAMGGSSPSSISTMGIDALLQQYLDHKQQIIDRINLLTNTKGLLTRNDQVISTQAELADVMAHIRDYANTLQVAKAEEESEFSLLDKQVKALTQSVSSIDAHRGLADSVIKTLSEVQTRANTLKMQERTGSRLSIISDGDKSQLPYKDSRKMLAMVFGSIGFLLPSMIVVFGNLLNPRYRAGEDAEMDQLADAPLLGVLPALDAEVDDARTQAGAAHCIHQIRVMLQVGKMGREHPVYLLTSATPGAGKTGVCSALAYSYALAGSRTLIIDADLIGRGLTHAFEVEGRAGFSEALREQKLNGFCVMTTVRNLWLLPAGLSGPGGASMLSRPPIEQVLTAARKEFDVVLIDSGPILGSVEASVIAQSVDGVIFVMARGQLRPLVKRALSHLRSLGGNVVGTVFNRATTGEFNQSSFASSARSRQFQGVRGRPDDLKDILGWNMPKGVKQPMAEKHLALGPLAESVHHSLGCEAVA